MRIVPFIRIHILTYRRLSMYYILLLSPHVHICILTHTHTYTYIYTYTYTDLHLSDVALLSDPSSGRKLAVRSSHPGVQVYTANWLSQVYYIYSVLYIWCMCLLYILCTGLTTYTHVLLHIRICILNAL